MKKPADRAGDTRSFIAFLNEFERLCRDHGVVIEAWGKDAAVILTSLPARTALGEQFYGAPQQFLGYAIKSPNGSLTAPRWHDGEALVIPIEPTYGLAAPKDEKKEQAACRVCGGPGYLIGRERNVTCDVCGGTGVQS